MLCSPKAPAPEHLVPLIPCLIAFSVQGAEELECRAEEAVKLTVRCQPGRSAPRPVSGVVTHTLQGGGGGGPGPKCQGTGAGWRSTCVPCPLGLPVPKSPPPPTALSSGPGYLSANVLWEGAGVLVSKSMPTGPLSPRVPICVPAVGLDLGGSAQGPQGHQPASELVRSLPSLDSPPVLKIGKAGLALCVWVSSRCGRSRDVLGRWEGARSGVRNPQGPGFTQQWAQQGLWLQPVLC